MPLPSFHDWLRSADEVPDATTLALLIAWSGAAGVSREGLARALGVPSEALADLLRALTATGQAEMLKVNGELRYRAAG
jgi:hypothetical protein